MAKTCSMLFMSAEEKKEIKQERIYEDVVVSPPWSQKLRRKACDYKPLYEAAKTKRALTAIELPPYEALAASKSTRKKKKKKKARGGRERMEQKENGGFAFFAKRQNKEEGSQQEKIKK